MIKKITILSLMIFLSSMINMNNLMGQVTLVNYDFNSGASYAALSPTLTSGITCTVNSTEAFATFGGIATTGGAFTANSTAGNAIAMNNSSGTNTRYYEFGMGGANLFNYSTFKIYFQAQRSGTGATLVTLQYSLNGGTYTTFASNTMNPGNGSFNAATINLPTAVDNPTATLAFRLLASGASSTGTLRIDNFQIQGTIIPAGMLIGNNGSQPLSGNIFPTATNNILQSFTITENNTSSTTLNSITIPLSGNYVGASDISASGLKLYSNTTNNFNTASVLSNKTSTSIGAGESVVFNSLATIIAKNTIKYFWVTADIASGATIGNTINAGSLNNSNFSFAAASTTAAVNAGGTKTIAPLTQLSAGFCAYTSTSTTEFIWADSLGTPSVASNDRYKFKLVNGASTLTWTTNNEWPVMQFYLIPGYLPSTTYTTSVAWSNDFGATFGPYGPTCLLTSPGLPTTQLSAGSCGSSPASYTSIIIADNVPGATEYTYQFVTGATTLTLVKSVGYNNFYLALVPNILPGTTYSVTVKAKVNNVYGPYGSSCNITTPSSPTTQLSAGSCGSSPATMTTTIIADDVQNATEYTYQFVTGATTLTLVKSVGYNNFYLALVPNILPSTTYSVSVKAKLNGNYGAYGPSCNITTPGNPTTQLSASWCNSSPATWSTTIIADNIQNATTYTYQFTAGASTTTLVKTTGYNNFYLALVPNLLPGTTYSVTIAAKVNGVDGAFGSSCNITTPATLPTSKLASGYCNTTASSYTQTIFADYVANASNYEFRLTSATPSYTQSLVKNNWIFQLGYFTGLTQNTTYTVEVRAKLWGVFGPYGTVCTLTTPNTAPPAIISQPVNATSISAREMAKEELNNEAALFDVISYPNPYNQSFGLNLTSYNVNENVSINIFDATGRLVETHSLMPSEVSALNLGSNYANGIYNIVVTQGSENKNIKIIKN